jgi:hypothetical protein
LNDSGSVRRCDLERVGSILDRVRALAVEYYRETGKPLGVTGEIAEFEAARILGLNLCDARQPGFDAVCHESGRPKRVQIKGRCILDSSGPGQRLSRIRLDQEWDAVVLVLLDGEFRPMEIYEAERPVIEAAIRAPGSKARNERGSLSVSKFKSLARRVWP